MIAGKEPDPRVRDSAPRICGDDPWPNNRTLMVTCARRIRGDDPDKTMGFIIRNRCSPYPRG